MTLYTHQESPLGTLLFTSNGDRLTGLYFADQDHAPEIDGDWVEDANAAIFLQVQEQLEEYMAGERETFDLPLHFSGTRFQVQVWQELAAIPFGRTISYTELAQRAVSTEAIRAVGTATGMNRISIIIPCHRVIGKNRSLTGYAGGLARKKALLEFESARVQGRSAVLELVEEQPALALV